MGSGSRLKLLCRNRAAGSRIIPIQSTGAVSRWPRSSNAAGFQVLPENRATFWIGRRSCSRLFYCRRLLHVSRLPFVARAFLEKMGIILAVEPHLPRTHLDGAAMLRSDGTPVVALTLRYDRLDNFWFTLSHELAHIT